MPPITIEQLLVVEGVAVRRCETSGEPWDYTTVIGIVHKELGDKLTESQIEQQLAAYYDSINGIHDDD